MSISTDKRVHQVTKELSEEIKRELFKDKENIEYQNFVHPDAPSDVWKISFERAFDSKQIGIEMNIEVSLGRSKPDADIVLFDPQDAEHLGVSRQHAILRPTAEQIYLIDLGSTNGTRLNGQSIGHKMPFGLSHGDHISFGRLEMVISIDARPSTQKVEKLDEWTIQTKIGYAILSQLKQEEIFQQALTEMAQLTNATEVSIWLVDSQTGELYLEVGEGTNNAPLRLPTVDSLAGKVLKDPKPLLINRDAKGSRIKLKTNYLVEAVIYVPILLGGVAIGVMSAVHKEPGKVFTDLETRIVQTVADYTAIALQNARQYEATRNELERRISTINSLNYSLKLDIKSRLNYVIGYSGIISDNLVDDEENFEMIQGIVDTAKHMNHIVDEMILLTSSQHDSLTNQGLCDLIGIVRQAVEGEPGIQDRIKLHIIGQPLFVQGNERQLQRSLQTLFVYALLRSPENSMIDVALIFWDTDIVIRVQDNGESLKGDRIEDMLHDYRQYRSDLHNDMHLQLELMHETIIAHHGHIHVHNIDDGGVEFLIKLPITVKIETQSD